MNNYLDDVTKAVRKVQRASFCLGQALLDLEAIAGISINRYEMDELDLGGESQSVAMMMLIRKSQEES